MNEVPKMISTKDLSYLEDMMNWNLVFSKKCRMYKDLITDKDVKELITDIAKMHTEHYEKLLNILN